MEINFENKTVGAYREVFHQIKRIQESAESVVPDTNDDIGRVASVQTSVLLKSKELTSRGVSVTGEICAALVYITEGENAVSFVRINKSFELEYEMGEMEGDIRAQIALSVTNCEARVINPRKVSVTVELAGELSCYRQETVAVETLLPEGGCEGLHAKFETIEAVIANAVCEKTFALNEQFTIPREKPLPAQIISQKAEFCVSETQHVGTKAVIKGSLELEICYLAAEGAYPVTTAFSSPFSQIIDTAEEEMDGSTVMIELTSAYFELIDTINGDKAVDAEIHAVLQLVSRRRREVSFISDAYSNLMSAECASQSSQLTLASGMETLRLGKEERISVAEDCADVLCVLGTLSQQTAGGGKCSASVAVDIIYRTEAGSLSAVRRAVALEGDCQDTPMRVISSRLTGLYLRPSGGEIDSRISAELYCQSSRYADITRVGTVTLSEEDAVDWAALPAVSIVRMEGESLWELAKQYHSCEDAIAAMNPEETAQMLLIPKQI